MTNNDNVAGLCERLRVALKSATPGTWYATDSEDNPSAIKADQRHCSVYVADAMEPNDQAFIACANPEAVTLLLDTLERRAAEIERLQEVVDELIKLDTGPKIRLRRSGTTDIRIEALTGED
jgi:hypothetical protein